MIANNFLLIVALFASSVSTAQAEECSAAWTDASGEAHIASIVINLASTNSLGAAALPQRTSGVACPRASIVPLPNDVRVLIELGVSLGIMDEGGRALWIWARGGRLQTTIDNGELSPAEAAAVREWSEAAQARFDEALSRR